MEPDAPSSRHTGMRSLALSCVALILPLSLAACGSSDGDHDVATDPVPSSFTPATPTPTPTPSVAPTTGTYPEFAPTDYTYELTVSCFCMASRTPIQITVADGQVVGATFGKGHSGRGQVQSGDAVDPAFALTINDVIARANDTKAASVKVDWPAGQDYPNSVYVDGSKQIADDEIGYTIANVQVS